MTSANKDREGRYNMDFNNCVLLGGCIPQEDVNSGKLDEWETELGTVGDFLNSIPKWKGLWTVSCLALSGKVPVGGDL